MWRGDGGLHLYVARNVSERFGHWWGKLKIVWAPSENGVVARVLDLMQFASGLCLVYTNSPDGMFWVSAHSVWPTMSKRAKVLW